MANLLLERSKTSVEVTVRVLGEVLYAERAAAWVCHSLTDCVPADRLPWHAELCLGHPERADRLSDAIRALGGSPEPFEPSLAVAVGTSLVRLAARGEPHRIVLAVLEREELTSRCYDAVLQSWIPASARALVRRLKDAHRESMKALVASLRAHAGFRHGERPVSLV